MQVQIPLIVGFISDLLFAVKIEAAAQRLNYEVRWIERVEQVAGVVPASPGRQLGEPLAGPEAVLIENLTLWKPALLIFDLGNTEIPWRKWIAIIKSVPATRRLPVLCYGSHVEVEPLKAAKGAGADAVLARSQFASALLELIQKYARVTDLHKSDEPCQEGLSLLARRGLEKFNLGEYFEAHEYLETAWNEDLTDARELYRAILQVAVAYLQIERGNYNGASKMFLRVRQWIDPLPDQCRGIDVAKLRADAERVRQELHRLGRERIQEFDRRLFQPVIFDDTPQE